MSLDTFELVHNVKIVYVLQNTTNESIEKKEVNQTCVNNNEKGSCK